MAEIFAEVQAVPAEIVTITPRAAEEIRRIKLEAKIPDVHALRLGVKGGGCSGMTYVLAFDETPKERDTVYELEGLKVCIDPKSQFYLSGTILEFSDGLNGRGFVFNNPNAAKTCGCGHSFGV
ncbi:MAG: iron-sulfur cluster assembly accessory protein [Ignavibacteriales bacterium]|nr:iron-sulfur cluster assembly accessory protein [Ignavibacteriales bacterium]